jgi:hypothetical protein
MYQPQVPLIASSPEFRTARLAQVELGGLILLRDVAAIGVRADALSARGDLTEGVLRLGPGMVRFVRCALDSVLVALQISYLVEADLTSLTARVPEPGDLVIAPNRSPAGLCVTGAFGDTPGVLDLGSAIIRPYVTTRGPPQVACRWKLVEREQRTRVLLAHEGEDDSRTAVPAPARRSYGEDSD